ncbi:hypothetical protein ACMV_P3_00220 (plasmid) [Acidiphilium multivorum AIU301]|uniref:Uncharacterized protein n=1 Tax=Acidiphilium multivorum (strain DSM 11245 / JCM 8867 / NBRC 100883 / AIU 301) TaxID=926570 RepID=F0J7V4_ACIMA|nr:hypothetical protein [Acidiphilium multivorum]BAJ83171.1 hypothetical protein ACMV_P3_00220 [Acidiphilium multivorum AIU301]GAN72486.1 hypothetical protein Apmu_0005_04 [Acidiphilium multivorum AIU301]
MATDIETAYREIAGFAPDQEAINRIRSAGRILRLQDQDSGWLLLITLEAHNAAIRNTLDAASTLAAAAGTAAADAGKAATAIAREIGRAGPTLAKSIQNAALEVGRDLRGSIDQATGAAKDTIAETIATGTTRMDGAIAETFRQATDLLDQAANNLRAGATETRDHFIQHWQSLAADATSKALDKRVQIEAARSRRASLRTFAIAFVIAAITFGASVFIAHRQGWQHGYRTGKADLLTHIHDQKLRASWANTPDGMLAYQLYKAGFIRELATCSGQGWKIKTRGGKPLCLPYQTKNGSIYGWFLK